MEDGPAGDDGGANGPAEAMGRGEVQQRAVNGVFWTMAHVLISLPVAFVINVVVARILGPVDYGRLAFLSASMDVVTGAVFLGVNPALLQFGSKAHAAGRRDEVRRLLSLVQGFRLIVIAPVLSVFVVLILRVDPLVVVLAVIFGVLAPAALDGAPTCLGIENKTAAAARVVLVASLLTQAAVLGVALTLATADAIWAARLVLVSVLVALALVPVSPDYRMAILRPRLPRGFPAGFWRFALPTGLASLISTLVLSRSEIFVLTWLSMPAAAGSFALAFGLAGHLFAPAQAILGPLVPAISGLLEVDAGALAPAFGRTLRAGSTIVAVLTGGALPAVALLVPLIYGEGFSDVGPLVMALGIAGGLLVVAGPVTAFTLARLSSTQVLLASLVALVADVGLALSLIPPFGVWGAVIANVSGSAVQLGLLLRIELKALGLTWRVVVKDAIPAVVGLAAAFSSWSLASRLPWTPVGSAALGGVLGLVLVVLGFRVCRTGLTADDAQAVRRGLPPPLQRCAVPLLVLLSRSGG